MRRRSRHDRDIRRKGEACLRGGRVRAGGAAPGPGPSSSPRSVQFRTEIGSVPHRDRSGGVAPGCRGHETGISARDRHFRASPTGPSSDSRRNVEFDVPRRCASGAVPPRTRDRARSWPPAPSSDLNRNAHVCGATSGRSWRRRRTRSECPRRPDHQCGQDGPAPDRLIARGEGRILMLDRSRSSEHVLAHREHPRPPTACASSTLSGRGSAGRNRSRAGTEPISARGGGVWRASSTPGPGRLRYRPTSRRTRPSTSARRALTP